MTSLDELHDQIRELERRLSEQVTALEAEWFALAERVRLTDLTSERASSGVDDLEEILTGMDERGEQVERRVEALDIEQFTFTDQLRRVADDATRANEGLDDLERGLAEVNARATAEFDSAMRQRQQALEREAPVSASEADAQGTDDTPVRLPTVDELYAWVAEHISPVVRKITATGEGGGVRWCRQWWLHQDAVDRFVALYWVFTELSGQATFGWLSVYLRDHLDPHLAILTSPFGPFYACAPGRHSDTSSPLGHAERDAQATDVVGTAVTARALAQSPAGGTT